MALQTPDFVAIRERYLQEVINRWPEAAVGVDSDHYVRACAAAAAVESLHLHLWWLSRQLFPDTADAEYLDRLATLNGAGRKAAAVATGTVRVAGTAATVVPAGLQLQTTAGIVLELTGSGTVGGGGTVDMPAWAVAAGTSGNLAASTALELVSPYPGLTGATVLAMAGGRAAEADADLRERLLEVMRNAPAGGNVADYRRWALEVPGVSRAFVFGQRDGITSVDVAIMTASGLPSGGLITQVTDYIEERRPVSAQVTVLQPDLVTVNVTATVTLAGTTLPVVQAAAQAAIADYIESLEPGDTVSRSRIVAAVQNVSGVASVDLPTLTPAADVTTTVNSVLIELPALGTVTLSL